MSQKFCARCVLPDTFPGITFDANGVCNVCLDYDHKDIDFSQVRREVEQIIKSKVGTGTSYDVVVAFSGGKDSTYALKYLREAFSARIIAITIDNDFLSDRAKTNCQRVTASLGIDHIFFRPNPKAMLEIYNTSLNKQIYSPAALKRASAICNSCIQVINTQILNFAINYKIPVVAGGYLGGQIPSETGFMQQNLRVTGEFRKSMLEKMANDFDQESLRLFSQTSGDMHEVLILNPMAYLNFSEEKIVEEILPLGWEKPSDTGKSSTNCLLNDFAIHHHKQKLNFHPYVAETAAMVRRGTISRDEGFKKLEFSPDTARFAAIEKHLNGSK